MRLAITILQLIISAVLLSLIILQAKGTGLGSTWGGSGEFYQSKRGVEKIIFNATIILTVLFGITSMVLVLIK